ncbi:MAG: InlB B-repeat-containing protein [Bacteroidales bacterium]|nr:InlB B-repeat-containing protein [Bacteroidales bacterium]
MADTNFKYDIAKPFQRTGAFPLDRTSVFTSISAATAYAAGDGSLGKSSYLGQVLAVVEGNSVDIYKIGYDSSLGKRVLIPIEGGGGSEISADQVIIYRSIPVGDRVIPVGATVTEAFQIAADAVDDMGSADGKLTEDIYVDGVKYAESGTSITTVLGDVYDKIIHNSGVVSKDIEDSEGNVIIEEGDTNTEAFEKLVDYMGSLSPNLEFVGDEDIEITVSGNVVSIGVKGISNSDEPMVLDEKKTITMTFNLNGGTGSFTPEVELTWGDYVEFELPSDAPVKSGSEFLGWKVDTDASGAEDFVIYQPGEYVRIINISELTGDTFSANALALWDDTPVQVSKYVQDLINEGYANAVTGNGGTYVEILDTCPYQMEDILDLEDVALNRKQLVSGVSNTIAWNHQLPNGWTAQGVADIYDGKTLNFSPRGEMLWAIDDSVSSLTITFSGGSWIAADYPWGAYQSEGVFAPRWKADQSHMVFASTPAIVNVTISSDFSSIAQVMFTMMATTSSLTLTCGDVFVRHDVTGMFESNAMSSLTINGPFRWDAIRTCHNMFDGCNNLVSVPYVVSWGRDSQYNTVYPHFDGTRGSADCAHMFRNTHSLESIGPVIDMSAISLSGCTIDGNAQAALSDILFDCPALTDVLLKGVGHNSWNFTDDSTGTYIPLMSAASIDYLLQNAQNVTDCSLTFSSINRSQVTSSYIEMARGKGWTINFVGE